MADCAKRQARRCHRPIGDNETEQSHHIALDCVVNPHLAMGCELQTIVRALIREEGSLPFAVRTFRPESHKSVLDVDERAVVCFDAFLQDLEG